MGEFFELTLFFIGVRYEFVLQCLGPSIETLRRYRRVRRTTDEDDIDDYEYSLFARHKATKQWSNISNLDALLSLICKFEDGEEYDNFIDLYCADSSISPLSYCRMWGMIDATMRLFADLDFLANRFEPALDEDRDAGKWNPDNSYSPFRINRRL
jgi:hypothetical protein